MVLLEEMIAAPLSGSPATMRPPVVAHLSHLDSASSSRSASPAIVPAAAAATAPATSSTTSLPVSEDKSVVSPSPIVYSDHAALLSSGTTSLNSSASDTSKLDEAQRDSKDEKEPAKEQKAHGNTHLHVLPKQHSDAAINPGAAPVARLTDDKP